MIVNHKTLELQLIFLNKSKIIVMYKLFIFYVLIIAGCGLKEKTISQYTYPEEIVKYNLESKYDSAKMILYEAQIYQSRFGFLHGNEINYDSTKRIPFVECELQFGELTMNQSKDTVEISLFMRKGGSVSAIMIRPTPYSVIFINDIASRIRSSGAGHSSIDYEVNERSLEIFKEELKLHYDSLNPWLKREAEKRGYI